MPFPRIRFRKWQTNQFENPLFNNLQHQFGWWKSNSQHQLETISTTQLGNEHCN